MFSRMNRHTGCTAVIAAVGFGAAAQGSIISSADPKGYQTTFQLTGADGVGQDSNRWFLAEQGEARYTAWANQKIDFAASLADAPADYRIGITAKNFTSLVLSENYSQFKVAVSVNGSFVDNLFIDASDKTWNTAWLDVGKLASDTTLTLTWLNDSYSKNRYDANIGFGAVQFANASATSVSSTIPAPASGMLFAMALGVSAPRRAREKNRPSHI